MVEEVLDRDWLELQYSTRQMTVMEIADRFNIVPAVIYEMMHKLGIPVRSSGESRRGSCEQNLGVINGRSIKD